MQLIHFNLKYLVQYAIGNIPSIYAQKFTKVELFSYYM